MAIHLSILLYNHCYVYGRNHDPRIRRIRAYKDIFEETRRKFFNARNSYSFIERCCGDKGMAPQSTTKMASDFICRARECGLFCGLV